MKLLSVACSTCLLFSSILFAGQPTEQTQVSTTAASVEGQPVVEGSGGETSEVERQLVFDIHVANISEIKANLIVFTRPSSKDVRDLAWALIDAHMANEVKLIKLSDELGWNITSEKVVQELKPMFMEAMKVVTTLEMAVDTDFERIYLELMQSTHKELLTKLQAAPETFTNTEIKSFVDTTKSAVEEHLTHISQIQQGEVR